MNRTFRLVWSDCRQTWTPVQETARSRGKPASRARRLLAAPLVAALLAQSPAVLAGPPAPTALPTGGQVAAGSATIATSGSSMTINQASNRAIVNWQTFNIGANAAVNFQQPSTSAVALNRVASADPSAIYGRLSANGQVFLVNPSGVLFGQGARVDVGGLVATTMSIRDTDFMNGNYRFTRDGARGSVVNQGEINAQYVALMAPEVRNEGTLTARMGTVALAAGEALSLSITGQKLVGVQVDKAAIETLVENKHLIQVDEGTAILSAQSAGELLGRVVNSGTVEANGITADGGTIRLAASGRIDLGGTLNANASANGKGGSIVAIADLGNAGSLTNVTGSLNAKGGSASGDGGFIETSASKVKVADSARVNTLAPNGRAGTWLIDPTDFTVSATGGDITGAALGSSLNTSNVTIQTGTGISGTNGDVFVNDPVSWSANTLTINAHRDVNVNATMTVTGTGGLSVEYGQGAVASGNDAKFTVNSTIDMGANTSLSTKFGSDGTARTYTIVNDRAGLESIDANVTGNFALGSNIVLTTDWVPLGNANGPIQGTFEGLGHSVSGMTTIASRTDQVGFFGDVVGSAEIRNLRITGATVTGKNSAGVLAGSNEGTLHNVNVTGNVGLTAGTLSTDTVSSIGGLVGRNTGTITRASSSANVSATGGNQTTGGGIGGLVGSLNGGSVSDSYATGSVSGHTDVGGLVGLASADVNRAYSTGAVTGTTNVGGLVGRNPGGTVTESYWDTAAYATSPAGTGKTNTELTTAATFPVSWDTTRTWNIQDGSLPAFITTSGGGGGGGGPVSIMINLDNSQRYYGDTNQPVLTGFSYTGTVDASDSLTGATWGTALTNFLAAGNYLYNGTANLLAPTFTFGAGRSIANYTISYNGNQLSVLARPITVAVNAGQSKFYNGTGGPDPAIAYTTTLGAGPTDGNPALVNGDALSGALARAAGSNVGNYAVNQGSLAASSNYAVTFTPATFEIMARPITVTADAGQSKVYNGQGGADPALTYATTLGTAPGLTGTALVGGDTLSGALARATGNNVGTYAINQGSLAAGSNYAVTFAPANFAVTAKPLTASGISATTREYSGVGNAVATLTGGTLTGVEAGDETFVQLNRGTGMFGDGNAGTNKAVTVTGTSVVAGTGGDRSGNYTVSLSGSVTGAITPKALTVANQTAMSREYNGFTDTVAALTGGTLSGIVTGDESFVSFTSGTGAFADGNAGTNKAVTVTGSRATGARGANYTVVNPTGLTANITPKALTLTGQTAESREFDGGKTAADGTTIPLEGSTTARLTGGTLSGFVTGDADYVKLVTGTGSFADANAGVDKAVTVTGTRLATGTAGDRSGNYSVSDPTGIKATITPQPITATLSSTSVTNAIWVAMAGTWPTAVTFGTFADPTTWLATLANGKQVTLSGAFNLPEGGSSGRPDLLAYRFEPTSTFRSHDLNYRITGGTLDLRNPPTSGLGFFNGILFYPRADAAGNASVALSTLAQASVGLRVFDSAQFTLGADLIAGEGSAGGDFADGSGSSSSSSSGSGSGSSSSSSSGSSGDGRADIVSGAGSSSSSSSSSGSSDSSSSSGSSSSGDSASAGNAGASEDAPGAGSAQGDDDGGKGKGKGKGKAKGKAKGA